MLQEQVDHTRHLLEVRWGKRCADQASEKMKRIGQREMRPTDKDKSTLEAAPQKRVSPPPEETPYRESSKKVDMGKIRRPGSKGNRLAKKGYRRKAAIGECINISVNGNVRYQWEETYYRAATKRYRTVDIQRAGGMGRG